MSYVWGNVVFGFIIVFVHSSLLLLISFNRRLRMQRSNQLLCNLTIGHILTGLSLFIGPLTKIPWGIFSFAGYFYASIALVMLSIDRCLFIRWPFRYNTIHVSIHVVCMATSPIIYVVIVTERLANGITGRVVDDPVAMYAFVYAFLVFNIVMLVANVFVFKAVKRQKRAIRSLQAERTTEAGKAMERRKSFYAFYVCFGCVATCLVFWSPCLVLKILEFHFNVNMKKGTLMVTLAVANLNPIFDAVIFIWFNKELRNQLKKLFGRKRIPTNFQPAKTSSLVGGNACHTTNT